MSRRTRFLIGSCAFVLIFDFALVLLAIANGWTDLGGDDDQPDATLTANLESQMAPFWIQCNLVVAKTRFSPSLLSFIRASTTDEGQELRLSGLTVYSNLANACQRLADVTNAKVMRHKIAIVSLANETQCTFQDLLRNAQSAGYSMVVCVLNNVRLLPTRPDEGQSDSGDVRLLIPLAGIHTTTKCKSDIASIEIVPKPISAVNVTTFLSRNAAINVDIRVPFGPTYEFYRKMGSYLVINFIVWFFVGPIVTLEWMRRTKKLCWMSGGQRVDEEQLIGNRTADVSASSHAEQTEENNQDREGEQLPLVNTLRHSNQIPPIGVGLSVNGCLQGIKMIFSKILTSLGYVILVFTASPAGISLGGWSFFRFDNGETGISGSIPASFTPGGQSITVFGSDLTCCSYFLLPLFWPTIQIISFLIYSLCACSTTWVVPTNVTKLIRSDWFASNIYLVILGVVVPYCSFSNLVFDRRFGFFASYNVICTVCNVLFIIILNKHHLVTRYVFHISVCMIGAYLQSNIVAVFYFILNSEGSLNNIKLTTLRTVAIGLTLNLSFSSSMHIIRKLRKPRESLFEGLSEK
ncbi:uncharacterized protein [Montipora capricornis]|uniref:uncharacterized protein n=1 Tax=Montipora capricornis TaxID=246305 RepID=UPI0035F1DAB8